MPDKAEKLEIVGSRPEIEHVKAWLDGERQWVHVELPETVHPAVPPS